MKQGMTPCTSPGFGHRFVGYEGLGLKLITRSLSCISFHKVFVSLLRMILLPLKAVFTKFKSSTC
jgi:hypothetical protein